MLYMGRRAESDTARRIRRDERQGAAIGVFVPGRDISVLDVWPQAHYCRFRHRQVRHTPPPGISDTRSPTEVRSCRPSRRATIRTF